MTLFTVPETVPFGVSFTLIVAIALLEGIGLMMSMSPSNWLDNALPEVDGGDTLDQVLGWLHVGRVPALVLLLLFLVGFTLFGYSLQIVAHSLYAYLPAWLAAMLAVPAGLATVRGLGALVARIVPRDESSAISQQTLVGRVGVVVGAAARRGVAGQARVKDAYGRSHYLMVEPDLDDEVFEDGAQVLIVRKVGAFYRCIANPHPGLM